MIELHADNALEYLRDRGWIGPGPAAVEVLGGGVSNSVLRIAAGGRFLVLKQSRPQLRTRDAWFSDLERVYREQEVMQFLHPLLPGLSVPEVFFVDRANFVFVMSHAPVAARVWKEDLLQGYVDLTRGEAAGRLLGQIHEVTARRVHVMAPFADHHVFVQLRVDPFYRRVQERRPEVAALIEPVVQQMLSVKEALCHGDFTPKNLLAHEAGFTLVDYETAHFGDPAMDLGLFLAHLVLKAVRHRDQCEAFFDLTHSFWKGYASVLTYRPVSELIGRGIGHFAACLLARIDGTSPVDYLPEEPRREAVRSIARRLLNERTFAWADALDVVRSELREV